MIGTVVQVSTALAGAETRIAAPAGSTVLDVEDALDLGETGGWLLVDGVACEYVAADHGASTVTLAAPLAADVPAGAFLPCHPPAPETIAVVEIEDERGEIVTDEALVPAHLIPSLPDGLRDGEHPETVTLDHVGDRLTVVDLPDREPLEVWGDPLGRHVAIDAEGLTVWDVEDPGDGSDPVQYRSTLLGGPGADQLLLSRADGTTAGIDEEGNLTAFGGDFSTDVRIAGVPLLGTRLEGGEEDGWLDTQPGGVVAWRTFDQISAERATNEEWGYASLRATLRGGRLYRVGVTVDSTAGVTGGKVRWQVRYAIAAAARVDSPILTRDESAAAVGPTWRLTGHMQSVLGYAEDTDTRFLLTYQGTSGATPKVLGATMWVEDIGAVLDYAAGGYSTGGAVAGGGTPSTPPDVTREYTTTWQGTSYRVYYGSGSQRSSSGELVQGYTGYYPAGGINRSAVLFGGGSVTSSVPAERGRTMAAALDGATIKRAEVRLTNRHWHSGSGGRALLGALATTSLPTTLGGTLSGLATRPTSGLWPRGARRWVTVPSGWFGPSARVLTLGGGSSTSSTFYGRFASGDVQVRLTYTR